jgi:hypothetical protein
MRNYTSTLLRNGQTAAQQAAMSPLNLFRIVAAVHAHALTIIPVQRDELHVCYLSSKIGE